MLQKDLTGMEFGRLKVVSFEGRDKSGRALWRCKCKCGNETVVLGQALKCGDTKSCGCLLEEVRRNTAHDKFYVHGDAKTGLYAIWANAKKNCTNPKARDYERYKDMWPDEWETFEPFKKWALENGYVEGESCLDRKDRSKKFGPSNSVFVDRKTISRRSKNARMITYGDRTKSLSEWAEITGMKATAIKNRLNTGWPVGPALFAKKGQKPTDTIIDDEGFMVLWPVDKDKW